jgi:hypothetical protein
MLDSSEAVTGAYTSPLLATLFWRERASAVRSSVASLLQHKRLPDASALSVISLLPSPPPYKHSRSPTPPQLLTPVLLALADALCDPVRWHIATQTFMDSLSSVLATFLFCKPAASVHGASMHGGARSSAHHAFICCATLFVASQWLLLLPQCAQQQPMLRLARLMLELLTVPRPVEPDDSARHHVRSDGNGSEHDLDNVRHLSATTLFLQGKPLIAENVAFPRPTNMLSDPGPSSLWCRCATRRFCHP